MIGKSLHTRQRYATAWKGQRDLTAFDFGVLKLSGDSLSSASPMRHARACLDSQQPAPSSSPSSASPARHVRACLDFQQPAPFPSSASPVRLDFQQPAPTPSPSSASPTRHARACLDFQECADGYRCYAKPKLGLQIKI